MDAAPLRIALLTDDKPGHRSQLEGLASAVGRQCETEVIWRPVGRFGSVDDPGPVDLAVAAGRTTHLGLVRLARKSDVRTVVLMRPSLPTGWFDLCIVPEHDGLAGAENIETTTGVLNNVNPTQAADQRHGGIVLVGGPSKHHRWDDARVFISLNTLLDQDDTHWTITTSRRTPKSTIERLAVRAAAEARVTFEPHTQTPRGWLATQLLQCAFAVVTEDSVSMLSEAITSGCRTATIDLPRHRETRVTRYVDSLHRGGYVTSMASLADFAPSAVLSEADRVATVILDRWWPVTANTQRRAA